MTAPPLRRRAFRAVTVAASLAAASLTAVLGATPAAAATPPWLSPTSQFHDAAQVGTLTFYDSSGAQIYGGPLTDGVPFAAYVLGSDTLRAGDTTAFLTGFRPDPATVAGASGAPNEGSWSGDVLSGSTPFPNATAPGALATATTPLFTPSGTDSSLLDLPSIYPTTDGVYELRLRTGAPGVQTSAQYDAAVVQITDTAWQVVYPSNLTTTTTALTARPASGAKVGTSVTLTATVSPASAGKVQFKDGSTALGTPVAVDGSGVATTVVKPATAATHNYSATFTATDTTVLSSTGILRYAVAKVSSTTAATWPSSAKYGTAFSVKAKVTTATGVVPIGKVSVVSGSTTLASATLASGAATLKVPATALKPGSHALTLKYAGSADVVASSSAAHTVKVAKASSTTTNALVRTKVAKGKRPSLTVVVKATVTATGTVSVYDGSKKVASATLTAAKKGAVTVTLPAPSKVGRHSVHAVFAGSTTVAGSSGKSVTLTVTK